MRILRARRAQNNTTEIIAIAGTISIYTRLYALTIRSLLFPKELAYTHTDCFLQKKHLLYCELIYRFSIHRLNGFKLLLHPMRPRDPLLHLVRDLL